MIVLCIVANIWLYENFLKVFKCCIDAIERVSTVVGEDCVARKVNSKHKPVPYFTGKRVSIFTVKKCYNLCVKKLVVLSDDIKQVAFIHFSFVCN